MKKFFLLSLIPISVGVLLFFIHFSRNYAASEITKMNIEALAKQKDKDKGKDEKVDHVYVSDSGVIVVSNAKNRAGKKKGCKEEPKFFCEITNASSSKEI